MNSSAHIQGSHDKLSRRELIQLAAALTTFPSLKTYAANSFSAASVGASSTTPIVVESIEERFHSLPFEHQNIGGLLGKRMQTNVEGRLLHIDAKTFLDGFIQHHKKDNFISTWVGEHAGKFLDAACNALRYQRNEKLRSLVDHVAKTLIGAQGCDGYLGTYTEDRRWTQWDVWVHSYSLLGLLSYYELSADPSAIATCRKIGNLLARTFGDAPGQQSLVFKTDFPFRGVGRKFNNFEFVTDELCSTAYTVDVRGENQDALQTGFSRAEKGEVWICAKLDHPTTVSRVIFKHGELTPEGGWFDTSLGKPRLQIVRQPVPEWSQDLAALEKLPEWEHSAVFESYPTTDRDHAPGYGSSGPIEIRLESPITVYGIRIIGKAARDFVTCAELSAYT